jgi:hypothetical protein
LGRRDCGPCLHHKSGTRQSIGLTQISADNDRFFLLFAVAVSRSTNSRADTERRDGSKTTVTGCTASGSVRPSTTQRWPASASCAADVAASVRGTIVTPSPSAANTDRSEAWVSSNVDDASRPARRTAASTCLRIPVPAANWMSRPRLRRSATETGPTSPSASSSDVTPTSGSTASRRLSRPAGSSSGPMPTTARSSGPWRTPSTISAEVWSTMCSSIPG